MEAAPRMPAHQEIEHPGVAPEDELTALRSRLLALEAELAETHRRTNAAIAAAQERVYWLDRWHVDLDELMRRRSGVAVRAVLGRARGMLRRLGWFTGTTP